ncbi:MAG: hypothetical protein F4Z41_08825 [Acidimicrobiia bacterium]|nr:hypothetical protein [Acidimicrobiia bacterium]MYD40980.1 hypothetical protein [Acidimicrobiia bacterium]
MTLSPTDGGKNRMMLPEGRSYELSMELIQGAIDIHVHATPHLPSSPRRLDPIEAAIQARDAGMQAIVLMDVFQMSNGVAWIVNRAVPDFKVYGGLILNTAYGGLNPRAVKTAIGYGDGAKFVSFGAHSTHYQASTEGRIVDGRFTPLKDLYPKFRQEEVERAIRIPVEGPVGSDLEEILELISHNPHIFLNTGHVSPDEAVRLVDLAFDFGIGNVLVATAVTSVASTDQLRYMAGKGAFIEYTLGAYTHTTSIPKTHYYVELEYAADEDMAGGAKGSVRGAAEQIREIGSDHCILATDFGGYTLPDPVEGMRGFIASLLDLGIAPECVRKLVKTNPEKLLGLG